MISDEYKAVLRTTHAENEGWGSGALRRLDGVLELNPINVLDYGCGKGVLGAALRERGIPCTDYDPGMPQFEARPVGPFDLVTCFDVMEHVEEQHVHSVLKDIGKLGARCRMSIGLTPAVKILSDGRNAHITLQPGMWWLERIALAARPVQRVYRASERHLEVFF